MPSVVFESVGERYTVEFSPEVSVTGKDKKFAKTISLMVDGLLQGYSPSLGDMTAYVATKLKRDLGVKIISYTKTKHKKGMVY